VIAIDSNVLIGLWNPDDSLNLEAQNALDAAMERGQLVIAAPVYVELRAVPGRDDGTIDIFLGRTGIAVDWKIDERIWREAARANNEYVTRRRKNFKLPRRVAADFVIGAHASVRGYSLLTFDQRTFRSAFPNLILV
jgi:predicted nucleic acid-binding protein